MVWVENVQLFLKSNIIVEKKNYYSKPQILEPPEGEKWDTHNWRSLRQIFI